MRRQAGPRPTWCALVRGVGAVAVAAAVAGLSGCTGTGQGRSEQPTTAIASSPSVPVVTAPPSDPSQVDGSDPEAVADAVAVTIAVRDGTADSSPMDSQARASRWYSPDLGSIPEGVEVERPDSHWAVLTSRQAHDVVDEVDRTSDTVPPAEATIWLTRTVTTHAEAADGWQGARRTTRYWITLTRAGNSSWQVSAISSQQVDPD